MSKINSKAVRREINAMSPNVRTARKTDDRKANGLIIGAMLFIAMSAFTAFTVL